MKWFKYGILTVAILVLFVISALIAVIILVDPTDYKDRIAEAVSNTTGRTLHIGGDIELSVFPWLGLELNQVSLDNPQGFSQAPFAVIQELNIKVALLPLLSLNVRVGDVQLQGLEINLERRQDGQNNWDDLLADQTAGAKPNVAAADKTTVKTDSMPIPLTDFYVGGIDIENARITWRDAHADTLTHIEYFNLETGAIQSGKETTIELRFACRNENPILIAGIELDGRLTLDLPAQQYGLNKLRINIKASGAMLPGEHHEARVTIDKLTVDLNQQLLNVQSLGIEVADTRTNLNIDARNILGDAPATGGNISITVPSIRDLLKRMGQTIPVTADESVLGKFTLESQFSGTFDALELAGLAIQFDDSTLTGQAGIHSPGAPSYRYQLNLDQINVDRYLPPDVSGAEPINPEVTLPVEPAEPELPIPVDLLRTLNASGEFRIGALQVMNLHMNNIETGLQADTGRVALKPLHLDLYDGRLAGDILLNVQGEQPHYSVNLDLAKVQSGPLLQDFLQKRLLEGQMNVRGRFDTHGKQLSAIKQGLNGNLDMAFKDGALSTDVRQRLRERKAELKQKLTGATAATDTPIGEPTKFSSITATTIINDGIIRNSDLEMKARYMYVTGGGQFALPDNTIDYLLTVLLSDDGAGQDDPLNELVDFPIEYHLKGKLEELNYARIATQALVNALKSKLKHSYESEISAAKAELERKQAEAKAKLEQQKQAAVAGEKAELERKKKEQEKELQQKLEKKKQKLLDKLLQ